MFWRRWLQWFRHGGVSQRLLLLECRIHGSHYYACVALVQRGEVQTGDALKLQREPNNDYDKYAIEVFDNKDNKLGYVPKNYNRVIATLMDQGCTVSAVVTAVEASAWEPVCIRIELRL